MRDWLAWRSLCWCGVASACVAMGAAVPTPQQVEWADCEIGVIIHQDVQVYVPAYKDHADTNVPPASVFNPTALDTDQWLAAAKSAGARYAVLVAKHCSGFSLWPTKAHPYSVASSPWKGGKGDIVADFIASCRKFGIKPGLYASTGRNNYFGVTDLKAGYKTIPDAKWNRYRDLVRTQLTELWTNYGPLFEIWFDGGNLPANRGGREIEDLIVKLQPNAIVFGGDPGRVACCRWVGNENATAPYDCWARWTPPEKEGYPEYLKRAMGAPDGKFWCPAESDIPNRNQRTCFQGGWFWRAGEEKGLYTPEEMLDRYMKSVGRNSNLLIGMVIDNRGRVPEADVEQFRRFGGLVRDLYRNRLACVSGTGLSFCIDLPPGSGANLCSIREDIAKGENVRRFRLHGFAEGAWKELASGGTVGHRRLATFKPGAYSRFRLELEPIIPGTLPVIRDFELYSVKPAGLPAGAGNVPAPGVKVALELPPGPDNPRNSEGAFLPLKDGRIMFVYSRYYGTSKADGATADLAVRYSSDNGATWSAADKIAVKNHGGLNVMSVSLLRLQSGEIALFYLLKNSTSDCRPVLRRSFDEGASWTAPETCITDEVGYYVLNNDRVIQLKSGRLLFAVSRHDYSGGRFDNLGEVMTYSSDDNGKTWRRGKSVLRIVSPSGKAYAAQEPGVVELKDGRVLLWIRTNAGCQFMSRSADAGETWSAPQPTSLRSPLSPASIKRLPTGDLLAVWNDHESRTDAARTPLSAALSRDEGQTWHGAKAIESDPDGWFCYTAIQPLDDGTVLLGYCAYGKLAHSRIVKVPMDWFASPD